MIKYGGSYYSYNKSSGQMNRVAEYKFVPLTTDQLLHVDSIHPPVGKYEDFVKWKFVNMGIKKVIFNDPATIVIWDDGTKTVVKCQEGDVFDKEKGLAMCICKHVFGNKSNFNNIIKKYTEDT